MTLRLPLDRKYAMFGSIVASESTGLLRTFSKRESTGLMISVKRAVSSASTAAI